MNGSCRLWARMRVCPQLIANSNELAAPFEIHTHRHSARVRAWGSVLSISRGGRRRRGRGRVIALDLSGNTCVCNQTSNLLRKLLFFIFPRVGISGQLSPPRRWQCKTLPGRWIPRRKGIIKDFHPRRAACPLRSL